MEVTLGCSSQQAAPQGWGEAADGVRRLLGGFALEWACSGTLGKQHGKVKPYESCCSYTSNSLLELKFWGSSRDRGKSEIFFAVNIWKSEPCDPLKNGNWCNCPQNDKLLITKMHSPWHRNQPRGYDQCHNPTCFFIFSISVKISALPLALALSTP